MGELPLTIPAASSYAEDVDKLFLLLVLLTFIFTFLVGAMLLFLTVRYRRGNRVDRSNAHDHNTLLEVSWSFGPLLLALGVFLWSAKLFASVYSAPPNAKEIFVIGKQWMWHLQHANGIRENNELHVPVGEPVKLTMISQDVIHAFYVPEFRMQRQVEPGHYTTVWFTPTRVGKYHLYCNMYCGTQHSEMGGWVYVMSKADYAEWVASGGARAVAPGAISARTGGLTMPQAGAALFQQYQCASCHSGDAVKRGRGPSLVGIYGKNRQLANGKIVKADDGYLRNVLFYPDEYPLAGWPQGMPSYRGQLTEEQVLQINAYIKTLSGATTATPKTPNRETATGNVAPGATTEETDGGQPSADAPAANTDNQQWRYMYGGEQYN
ncbi:MAG: cytochrome c oxidase subunit II [Capsulimonadales bacterium]|nr:cytochrome c oxidase subunit II [Capsulimonadales bacterium]